MATESQNHADIRKELKSALNTKLDFTASFSFKQHFPLAPNPSLSVQEIGTIGLPLSQRDADAIKSVAEQAPFGMGERTVVDKSVRDTWEIDAKLVNFRNPHWALFMTQAVRSVCETLGVNYAASEPRCDLYKMLLYETGSHFLPHVDTEKADGMFATIIVVLPSEFTGGDAHLSHGSLSTVYDSSKDSSWQTTVLAWYTDVTHEIKPIESGYRLALAYNLIHTKQSLRPALSKNEKFSSQVKETLISWNERAKAGLPTPNKILYLLDHMYSRANLRASALKGADDHKIALLELVAKELDFHLGFANIACHLQGAGDDDGPRHKSWGYDHDSDDDEVGFMEIYEREVRVEEFVDLDGIRIARELDFDEKHETIPYNLVADIEAGPYDDQQYEGYMGNGAGSLERWYRRTVLVLWPDAKDCEVRFSGDYFAYALERFGNSNLSESSRDEIINHLIANVHKNPSAVWEAVGDFALDKEDIDLWIRCVKACGAGNGLSVFKTEDIIQALDVLAFDKVKSSLEFLLQEDKSNQRRYDMLTALKEWATTICPEEQESVSPWIEEQFHTFLRSLKAPTKGEQVLLVELCVDRGGIEFFRDSIFCQIDNQSDGDFLMSLAIQLFTNKQLPPSETKTTMIRELLTSSILRVKFEVTPPKSQPSHILPSWSRIPQAKSEDSPDPLFITVQNVVLTCHTLGLKDLEDLVLERLSAIIENPLDGDSRRRTERIILPSLDLIFGHETAIRAESIANLEKILRLVVDAYLTAASPTILSFNQKNMHTLLHSLTLLNTGDLFFTSVLPKLSQVPPDTMGLASAFRELYDCQSRFTPPEGYSGISVPTIVDSLVAKYVKIAPARSDEQILQVFHEFLDIKADTSIVSYLNARIFTQTQQVVQTLERIITSLRPLINKYGADALAPVCRGIMMYWVLTVLGKKPDLDAASVLATTGIKQWTCTCAQCNQTKNFLNHKPDRALSLARIGAPLRKHLEQQIGHFAYSMATYDTIRTTPQGLTITKTDRLWKPQRWQAAQTKGLALLQQMSSDEDEFTRLLGESYDTVTSVLRGAKRKEAPVDLPNPPVAGPSTGTSTAATQPTKKRKIIPDPSTVIDLTSD